MNPTHRGFANLPCPYCDDHDSGLSITLYDTSDFNCAACGESFTVEDVADFPEWSAVIAWVESAPTIEE